MAKPYSADLRERVLLAGEAGLPPAIVSRRFGVGLSTVYLWRQAGTRRRPTLCQAACRRSHAGDRCGGRGDLAGAGEGAERSYAGRIQRAVGGAHRAAASKPADAVPRPAAVWVVA